MDATEHARRFNAWLDSYSDNALASPIAARLIADGEWTIDHTGGGCTAWNKRIPGGWIWLTDESGTDLGETIADRFIVGVYANDYDDGCNSVADTTVDGLDAALAFAKDTKAWRTSAVPEWMTPVEATHRAFCLADLIAMQTEA